MLNSESPMVNKPTHPPITQRYAYEKLESTSITHPQFIFALYNSEPSELPHIEGYRFIGNVTNLMNVEQILNAPVMNDEWKMQFASTATARFSKTKGPVCTATQPWRCSDPECPFHHPKIERLPEITNGPSVGPCESESNPCQNRDCRFHQTSSYHYWSEPLDSWHDCGHYYHPPVGSVTEPSGEV